MDKELKEKWMKALRSGRYEQGSSYLYADGTYCCLGVLCLIQGAKKSDIEYVHMPVQADIVLGFPGPMEEQLARMNDGRGPERKHTFAEIADYIEANL